MGEILLLEELMDEILAENRDSCTMVGKKEWIDTSSKKYDFIFHAINRVPYKNLRNNEFLLVPYLPYNYPEDSDQAKVRMHEIYKDNSSLTLFAISYNKTKVFRSEFGEKRRDRSFKFFDLKRVDIGTEIVDRETYHVLSEKDFEETMPNWPQIRKHLSQWKKRVNDYYHTD